MRLTVLYKRVVLLLLAVLCTAFHGCDVHEFPKLGVPTPLKLKLNFNTELPPFLVVNYGTKQEDVPSLYDIRYQIKAYMVTKNDEYDHLETGSFTFTAPVTDDLNYETTIILPAGEYMFKVWADYVRKGSPDDLYHNTSNFNNIRLTEPHTGNTDFRDGFTGSKIITVENTKIDGVIKEDVVEMERPLAKFIFITTDLDEFIEKETKTKLQELLKAGRTSTWAEDSTKAVEVKPEDYYLVFKYPLYMPCAYSIFEDRPVDSKTGVQFNSVMVPLSQTEATLGFDYVLVNGKESSAQVAVELYNKKGEILSNTGTIDVPLKRSKLTEVRGAFLTLETGGGVAINPDFNGDHNIYIP